MDEYINISGVLEQPMAFRNGLQVCKMCFEGKHPHKTAAGCKVLFDWYVNASDVQRLELILKYRCGGQCRCIL